MLISVDKRVFFAVLWNDYTELVRTIDFANHCKYSAYMYINSFLKDVDKFGGNHVIVDGDCE